MTLVALSKFDGATGVVLGTIGLCVLAGSLRTTYKAYRAGPPDLDHGDGYPTAAAPD